MCRPASDMLLLVNYLRHLLNDKIPSVLHVEAFLQLLHKRLRFEVCGIIILAAYMIWIRIGRRTAS
jgi:hypothetical protein